MKDVTAVVIGSGDGCLRGIDRSALAGVVVAPSLGEVHGSALEARSPYLWLVDAGARPAAQALALLVEAGPELVASLPVDRDGRPAEELLGRFTENDVPGILDAVSEQRVPLRHTHVISLVAPREAVLGARPPDPATFGRYAGTEWTWRLFAREPGMLIPRSTVRAPRVESGRPLHAMRMARTGAWGRGEAIRELRGSVAGRNP